ncbi:MAG TPA: GYD domain-containing protein, partial [Solirubrobacteraceae bacterium]|nr:GYD domain-containing protein [Solirubrobacteraceae bacterium]
MPKYLITGSYTSEGAKGVVAKGGSDRRAAVEKLAESVSGTVDCFYFAFGGDDIVTIIDAPDNESIAAVTMTVGASGMVDIRTTVL